MRALIMPGFGDVSQLVLADAEMPRCEAYDVLIRVVAAGVNPVDWKELAGFLQPFYPAYPAKWTPGYDAAGIVEKVGANVTAFQPGDRVVAFSDRRDNGHNGTFAEYVRVQAKAVAHVPSKVRLEDAAGMPTAALTGYQALFRASKGDLKAGQSVYIHGASGGVGSYVVQFAKAGGLAVAASCSARNIDYVRSLGADHVFDYAAGSIASQVRSWRPEGVNGIVDCFSGNTLPDALDMLAPAGALMSIATLNQDGDVAADSEAAERRGFRKILAITEFDQVDKDMDGILALMAQGKVTPPPLRLFPLSEGGAALELIKEGGVRGKLIIQVTQEVR